MTKPIDWKLVTSNFDLCYVIARRLQPYPAGVITDDLVWGPGVDTLMRCSQSWRPSNGRASFTTYAWRSIAKSMMRYLRVYKQNSCLSVYEVSESAFHGLWVYENNDVIDVYNILGKVSRLDQLVLVLRYWKHLTLSEIGLEIGCSTSMACYYVSRALKHCQEVVSQNASLVN